MTITGKQLIGGEWITGEGASFHGIDPTTKQQLMPAISTPSSRQVETTVSYAQAAGKMFKQTSPKTRAMFLRDCSDQIFALGDELIERVMAETGYPRARAEGERARTCNQLQMFADYIDAGDYLDARIDTAMPDRQPLPRPDLRHINHPLGAVVVFGAGNFPLAFSVAGGDTASALAAGCPIIVKGHPSHPGTGELVAQALAKAAEHAKLPRGVVSYLIDSGHSVGVQLVKSPAVKAVGFTGSFSGGTSLMKIANDRPEPIPVFAEMGSSNPVFALPLSLKQNAEKIAEGFIGSMTMGSGQFCVKPGLFIAVDDQPLHDFIARCKNLVEETQPMVMLNDRICHSFQQALSERKKIPQLEVVAHGYDTSNDTNGFCSQVTLYCTTADAIKENPNLMEETFGPASIIVRCKNADEFVTLANLFPGQLTATVQCAEGELADYLPLMDLLEEKVGRVVINGFPTGVEVCHSMVHGGPFPATSDQRFTSVGTNAVMRFVRPVCYQNYPEDQLPEALRNNNPLNISRLVNGVRTTEPVGS